ncbi:MAG: hypothetical protein KZQ73_07520 [Candidatus Thiodiazotropha sp. (ex Semelilucina semeliformis)]|nr:hypothetical protein [Candidatus Thiodiazotropha sp. (ex Myrtea spinifera)]MCU7807702.1 hypothetical protein [Candidatus Thiodiazotropha sp. (ex Semelilucina semeliformis)]MCU7830001.1 hypothetical protein [Candidatus Thiodiazotropha sp. (ex Myrtea sp. 'scaly one' KF741663)]
MKFEISDDLTRKAKIPHDIFLTNLIGNHILWFVAALGLVRSYWQPLALVPIVSLCLLIYTLWRAKQSRQKDPWYVMVHWQIAAERSRFFIYMLLAALTVALLGWIGYSYLGMMKVAVMALVGGVSILPIMVTVLVLILMESDALHQATLHKLSQRVVDKYPLPDDVVVLDDEDSHQQDVSAEAEVKS